MPNTILETALNYHQHGLSLIPVRQGTTKAPAIAWTPYKTTPATTEQLHQWFGQDHGYGLGIVTGTVSNNLELLEIEGRAAHRLADITTTMNTAGLADLWARISNGWLEQSPSGGYHWFYRITDQPVPGNDPQIAKAANKEVLAETRGTGGYVVAAPTPGTHHATGKPWATILGGPATAANITMAERNQIHQVFKTVLDETPPPTQIGAPTPNTATGAGLDLKHNSLYEDDGERPGDQFNRETSWADILTPAGWTFWGGPDHDGKSYWTRPGKDRHDGRSASTNPDGNLYVFTSSTDLEPNTPHTKFYVHAHYNHGGDLSQATRELRAKGYGAEPKKRTPTTTTLTKTGSGTIWDDTGLRTHQRIAARFTQYAQGQALYINGTGWHHWDGTRWAPDEKEAHTYQLLTNLLKDCWLEAIADKDLAADVKASMTATGSAGVLALASRSLFAKDVDHDPYLLNTPNGTLDLHTLTLRAHNPADLITKTTRATYDPEASSQTWEHFLETSLPNVEVREFLQRYSGLALVGKVIEHILLIATGKGRNGKGVLARTLQKALGDYAVTATNDLLISGRHGHKSAGELAAQMRLRGARWAVMSELNRGDRMNEATMKTLVGGDPITAKHMGQNWVEFDPSHSFIMLANDLPLVAADDQAAWDRIRVVPFDVSFAGREDTGLEERLELELEAVLTWAVAGLFAYQKEGLNAPATVLQRTDSYHNANDPVARFIDEECILHPSAKVASADLQSAFVNWAQINGEELINSKVLGGRMAQMGRGIAPGKVKRQRGWVGVGLVTDSDDFALTWDDMGKGTDGTDSPRDFHGN